VYVYNVEDHGEHGKGADANGHGNGSIKSVNHDAEHDAQSESITEPDCESESGVES